MIEHEIKSDCVNHLLADFHAFTFDSPSGDQKETLYQYLTKICHDLNVEVTEFNRYHYFEINRQECFDSFEGIFTNDHPSDILRLEDLMKELEALHDPSNKIHYFASFKWDKERQFGRGCSVVNDGYDCEYIFMLSDRKCTVLFIITDD